MMFLTLLMCVYSAEAGWSTLYEGSTPRPVFGPYWSDLDKRRLPKWYEEAKIGILVHWGIYSVPGYYPFSARNTKYLSKHWMDGNPEITDFMKAKYGKQTSYEDFARQFTASKFNPEKWADIFKTAGAKYVILTSKDGDGFTLFPSHYSPGWNSKEIGPKSDLVGNLKRSCQRHGLEFGIYYYLIEWYEPSFITNIDSKVLRSKLVEKKEMTNEILNSYFIKRVKPELEQLVRDYEPKILWADGGDQTVFSEYLLLTEFIAWLYNESPVGSDVVINDRWHTGTWQHHGDFFTSPIFNDTGKFHEKKGEFREKEKNNSDYFNPRTLKTHKWEHLISLDKMSLGYRKLPNSMPDHIMSSQELIETVVITVSCGGNVLINIGATHEGLIPKEFKRPLRDLGKWLNINGEAIYATSPWQTQNETSGLVWYTCKTNRPYSGQYPIVVPFLPDVDAIYAVILKWPDTNILRLEQAQDFIDKIKTVKLLGNPKNLTWYNSGDLTYVVLPKIKGRFAWTLKFNTITDEEDQDKEDQDV